MINKAKSIIKEEISKILFEHRDVVYELDTAISVIKENWKSPDDAWWIKIEQRRKDFKMFNIRHKYGFSDKNFKYWKPVNWTDGTRRENHVGYCIVRGRTKEEAINSLKNAVVHLHPWASKIYGSKIVTSNGNMEAIIKVCDEFYARAYMVLNPRSLKQTIRHSRSDQRHGLNKGREFQAFMLDNKEENGLHVKWKEVRPWGLIDCDVDNRNAQMELENYLKRNNVEVFKSYLSHDGKHYLLKTRDAENLDFSFLDKYNSNNRYGDPNCLFKGDANMMIYSSVGKF